MLRLITSYAHDRFPGSQHRVGGLNLHLPALAEHEDDGTRWLIMSSADDRLPDHLWTRALGDGAAGLLLILRDGVAALPGHHVEGRISVLHGRFFRINLDLIADMATFAEPPTYHEVLDQLEAKQDPPRAAAGFVHLHTHAEYSALDGLSKVDEILREVTRHGQTAVGLTDHGTCAGHPALQRAAEAAGVKPIFGIEANLTDDRFMRGDTIPEGDPRFHGHTKTVNGEEVEISPSRMLRNAYWHLCLFAESDTGLRNIWAASTEGYGDGFYDRPRMDWDTLARFSEGVIASTGCLRGPVAVALKAGDHDLARARLTRLMDIYPGRLYVELQPNDMPDQIELNKVLVAYAREFDLPLLATTDSHYATKADSLAHKVWIAVQQNRDLQDESDLFSEDLSLYVMSEAEVRAGLAYLGQDVVDEAITNTAVVADRCNARIGGELSAPTFTGDPEHDYLRLDTLCGQNWERLPLGDPALAQVYRERYKTEMALLKEKGFAGYYLMVADYVGWAKDNGILVGPGRGSGGGSLVAYLARITSLDPIKHGLLFERFLTRGRSGLPDFDVDFPASKKAEILAYIRQRWGAEHVVTIGTEGRLKNKAVLDNVVRAMRSQLPEHVEADLKAVKELIKEAEAGTAGLGMSWEDLWIQFGDQLQPYADRYPQVFAMAEKLVGRLKSYGRHAAGVVISTGAPLTDWLPMRTVEGEDQRVTQWSMNDVEQVGLVKFDFLTLTTLDVIQACLDLVAEQRGYKIDLEAWEEEFEDPGVWENLQNAQTLGVFQVDTHSGTRMCERMQPRNIDELADMITIVRPGPMNSGLTDAYLRRRAGEQAVSYPDPRLEQVLAPTHGCMIYQEQVMAVTRLLAGYDESEADGVRRILGKKKVTAISAAGDEFLARVDMPRDQAAHLWAQMAEFSKYGFNKSHAYAYAFLAFWTAFLKANFPREFLIAGMSTVDKDKIPSYVKEARRLGVAVLPPDINISGASFRPDFEQYAIRYGLTVKGVGEAAVADIEAGQPYASWDDYIARKGPKANAGVTATLAKVGAFDSLVPNRRGLEAKLLAVKTGEDSRCIFKKDGVHPLPDIETRRPDEDDNVYGERYEAARIEQRIGPALCTFDWTAEERPTNPRTGKLLALKPPPKKCTRACRQYNPQPALQIDDVAPYTPEDIRQIELELLGTYLTSSPFDRMDPEDRADARANAEALTGGPHGSYVLAGLVTGAQPHRAYDMGFLSLETEVSSLRLAVYSGLWTAERPRFVTGSLAIAEVRKTDKGLRLIAFQPI